MNREMEKEESKNMEKKISDAYAAVIKDSEFIRGNVPMTKEEIRTISLSKLGITNESVIFDIGAGTGSVSVTAALMCPEAMVYAFEKNDEAVELIGQNCNKFDVENVEIVVGDALENLRISQSPEHSIKPPTHVFIGGSGGKLIEIVKTVRSRNEQARFVVNAVTLETLDRCLALTDEFPEYADMDIIQMGVARAKAVGRYHMMTAENPIYIISFGGKCENE